MTDSNVSSLMPSIRARQDVAAAVRAHMAVRGIKDAELARDLGWSQSYMSRRTNAGTSFSVDDLGVLATHFDLTVADLVQMPTGRPIGGGSNLVGVTPLQRGALKLVGPAGFEPTASSVKSREFADIILFPAKAS